MISFDSISTFFWRTQFDGEARQEFYRSLSLYLKNNVPIKSACESMYSIYSDEERKPNRVKAIVAQDCLLGITNGRPIYESLETWVKYDEYSTIAAGAKAGNKLPEALDRAVDMIDRKKRMTNAVISATAYPTFILFSLFVACYYVAVTILPKLLKVTSHGHAGAMGDNTGALVMFSHFVANYGVATGFAAIALVLTIALTMDRFTGPARVYLDRVPPWSMYRIVQGAVFIYNVGVLLKGGVQKVELLETMAEKAKPWLRERIEGALLGVKNGRDLGTALYEAGHDFPSREAIQYIRVIGSLKGGDEQLQEFGELWMTAAVHRLEKNAAIFNKVAIALGGLMLISFAAAINEMANNIITQFGG